MNNQEILRLAELNKSSHLTDYICIGYGCRNSTLRDLCDLERGDLYQCNNNAVAQYWEGNSSIELYYITRELYNSIAHSLEQSFPRALTYVGKAVLDTDGDLFVVKYVNVYYPYNRPCWCVDKDETLLESRGWIVMLEDENAFISLDEVKEVTNKMKLTNDYDALVNVEKGVVEVGCQSIPFDKIDELVALIKANQP